MPDNKNLVSNSIIQALQITFGRSDRQLRITKGQEIPQEKISHGDFESKLSRIWTGQSDIQTDRLAKYRDFDKMDINSTECSTALDIYGEEAACRDTKTGMKVWIDSSDKNTREELNGFLQRIKMEFKAYGIYRNIAKYGDAFTYLVLGAYGIHDTITLHPSRIERVQEDGLLGFKSPQLTGMIAMDNRVGMLKSWDVIHMRLLSYDQESIYGKSMLDSLRKTWKQLSMLECYDDTTEILTKDHGWILFKNLTHGEAVATRNPDTKNFEWQIPTKIYSRNHSGEMIALKGKSIDLLVTPNHRVLLDKLPKGKLEGPIEYYANHERVIRAKELVNNSKNISIPKFSGWDGGTEIKEKIFSSIPNNVKSVRGGITMNFTTKGSQERVIAGDDFCALMGMYLSEGCINNKKKVPGRSFGIRIAQQKESKGYIPFKELLKRINNGKDIPYDGHAFHLNWKTLNPYFEQFGLAADKFIPDEIMNATPKQLRIFFDYFVLGDGYFEKEVVKEGKFSGERRVTLTTISKRMATQFVEIIQKLGYGVSIKIVHPKIVQFKNKKYLSSCKEAYTVRVLYSENNYFKAHSTTYTGTVHCVHVPNKFVLVRRNNKIVWGANTMMIIYRISKSVQRNIFKVDVGQASVQETQMIIKDYEKFLKNKQTFIDPKTNDFKLDFNPATLNQDFVWPTRPGSESRVETLAAAPNPGSYEDVEHFRNKMVIGLGIPKAYLEQELESSGWNSKDALLLQSTRFGRKIIKLQDAFKEGIIKMCQIHYAITHQQYLDPSSFTVQLGTFADQAERAREDVLLRKAQILEILSNISIVMSWNRQVWSDYLLDEIFPLPPTLRQKLFTPDPTREEEFKRTKELAKLGGSGKGMDKLKDPKPPKKVTADNLRVGLRGFGSKAMSEEFPEISEEFTEQLNKLDAVNSELQDFINIGELVNQNICGFRPEELQELIDTSGVIKERFTNLVPGQDEYAKKINWKQLHEMSQPDPTKNEEEGY